MTLRERLQLSFTRRIVRTPAGRAFVFRQLADAEANGESAFFDRLLSKVDDAKLQAMIARHRDDEVRHAALYAEAAARTGIPDEPVPDALKIVPALDRALGGVLDKPIEDARGIMRAYLMLQVVEERGITQFGALEQALREVSPADADLVASIRDDEARHLKMCHAISKRYAPSEIERQQTLRRYRELEARVYAEQQGKVLAHVMERGYFDGNAVAKTLFRALAEAGRRTGDLPYTSYARAA